MKNKFVRIISPITLSVVLILDIAVLGFTVFAVQKVIELHDAKSIFFAAVVVFAIIVGILVTIEVLKNGIIFHDDELEFTGIDDKNIFPYDTIEEIETYQDITASLKKNFVDRHALIMITQTDKTVTTIDVGLATRGTLKKIRTELAAYIGDDKIKCTEPKTAEVFKQMQNKNKDNADDTDIK